MNRLAAILLIVLFLFNLIGYKGFFYYLQERSDAKYQRALNEATYDDSRMITLKVDLNMPYLPQNSDFERIEGEITIDGHIYKYVKRKIENGQLVLLCLPDDHKTRLQSADKKFFAGVNNLAAHNQTNSSSKHTVEKNASDYDRNKLEFLLVIIKNIIRYEHSGDQRLNISALSASPEIPPEQL